MGRWRIQWLVGLVAMVIAGTCAAQTGRITFSGAVVTPTAAWPADRAELSSPRHVQEAALTFQQAVSGPELLAYAMHRDPSVRWTLVTLTYE